MGSIQEHTLSTQYREILNNLSVSKSAVSTTKPTIEEKDPNMIPLADFDLNEIMGKRSAELSHAEKAAKNLHLLN